MEENLIKNESVTKHVLDLALEILSKSNIVGKNKLSKGVKAVFGYIFLTEEKKVEALFKIIIPKSFLVKEKQFYFAFQKGELMLIDINEAFFQLTIEQMKSLHECIRLDSEKQEIANRKAKSIKILKEKGVTVVEKDLPYFVDEKYVKLNSNISILKKAVLCYTVSNIANNAVEQIETGRTKKLREMLAGFDIKNEISPIESNVLNGKASFEELRDCYWETEWTKVYLWYLGLIDIDITDASKENCFNDLQLVDEVIFRCSDINKMLKCVKPKETSELLDKLDLLLRYELAIRNKAETGNLDFAVVIHRARAMEWIIGFC